jgi:hypothetical protein
MKISAEKTQEYTQKPGSASRFYDHTGDEITLDAVERIAI